VSQDAITTQTGALEDLVKDALSESWEAFKKDAVLYVLANLVLIGLSMISLGILIGPLTVGMIGIVRKRRRGEAASVGDIFAGFSSFGASFGAMLIGVLGVLVGVLLLVVPGLVFAFLSIFTFHGIAYRNLGSIASIKHSIAVVKGHALAVFVIMLVTIVINAVGGMVWVGGILTGPFTTLLLTVVYEKLSANLPAD
jgi:hypothetical protein